MLALRLQCIFYLARATKTAITKLPIPAVPAVKKQQVAAVKDKLDRLHKTGPELEVAKILAKGGLLTSREIWRSYQIQLDEKKSKKQQFTPFFASLSQLKKTLGFMRTNGKISSGGYDRRKRMFKGWKLNQERAFKYVHPAVISEVEQHRKKMNEL